jgi:hypothetical protein
MNPTSSANKQDGVHYTVVKDHSQRDDNIVIVSIDWKAMAIKDWILCAEDAGDPDWMVTRDIASENPPEGLNMVYRNAKLIAIHYCLPTCLACGSIRSGGKNINYRQREQLEEDFYHAVNPFTNIPYAYVRKSAVNLHPENYNTEHLTATIFPPEVPITQHLPNHHSVNSNTTVNAIAMIPHDAYNAYSDAY